MREENDTDVIETLNELIQLDFDAIKAYEQALDRVDDDEVDSDLESFKADHERHIEDLSQLVRELGGVPKDVGRDLKGVMLEGLTALRSATGTLGALRAMRMNEKLTNRTYEKAVSLPMPSHARAVLAVNFEDERRHLLAIESHIERLGDEALEEDLAVEADRADHIPNVRM